MEKDYKYYKNLPALDEAKIKSLIRPSNEVDDFIKKGEEKLNDPEFDKETMLLYTIDEIRDFVGEDFWSATEQPQHIAMTEEERCLERMKEYYDKIFKAYYNQLDGMGEDHDFSGSRKAFLRTSKKFQIQFKNMLFEMKVSEEDFWKRFDRNSERYWLLLSTSPYAERTALRRTDRNAQNTLYVLDKPYDKGIYGRYVHLFA